MTDYDIREAGKVVAFYRRREVSAFDATVNLRATQRWLYSRITSPVEVSYFLDVQARRSKWQNAKLKTVMISLSLILSRWILKRD